MSKVADVGSIEIWIYNKDHPPPHVHAITSDARVGRLRIEDGVPLTSELRGNERKWVVTWITLHRDELRVAWAVAQAGGKPARIP